ncbi:CrcB family protein [uncultured Mailhella sp.]|uniref:fluoride efflux transporter FluC n=1 Tax=uncultured Mailhella sp. TaxID=1981031 RepID=UPI0025DC0CE6|nr:CrcB family protein [uncultured Mailhella sp.]
MTQFAKQTMAVLFGGALGAVCRVKISWTVMKVSGLLFPLGILCVNMTGSFLLGILMGVASRVKHGYPTATAFLATGFFGGFTTFSSFALDTVMLWGADHALFALLNVGLNTALCVALAGLGWMIGAPRGARRS